jgi:hypothetical protein
MPVIREDRRGWYSAEIPGRGELLLEGSPVAERDICLSRSTVRTATYPGDIRTWSDRRIRWAEFEIPIGAIRFSLLPKTTAAHRVCASRHDGAACNPVPPQGGHVPA